MALSTLTPGSTANWTTTADPGQVGVASDDGYDEKVIARWHTPCYENYSTTKVIGVIAFHACGVDYSDEGIDKVTFIANDGTPVDVTEPTQHPVLGYWGWWIELATAASDGIVEVRAIVYPHSGYCRVLQGGYATAVGNTSIYLPTAEQSLLVWSNAGGTYGKVAYIDATSGDDTNGAVTYRDSATDDFYPTNIGTTGRTVRWDWEQNARAATTQVGAYAATSEYQSGDIFYITDTEQGYSGVTASPFLRTRSVLIRSEGIDTLERLANRFDDIHYYGRQN